MRKFTFIILLLVITVPAMAQLNRIDSLRQLLLKATEDTNHVNNLSTLSNAYINSNPDSALLCASEGLSIAKKIKFKKGEVQNLRAIAAVFNVLGNYPLALRHLLEALKITEEMKDKRLEALVLNSLADAYFYNGDVQRSIKYSYMAIESYRKLGRTLNLHNCMMNLADTYEKMGKLDSALYLMKTAWHYFQENKTVDRYGICQLNFGNIYRKSGKADSAMNYYRSANAYLKEVRDEQALTESYLGMATLFLNSHQTDSSLIYAKLSFSTAKNIGNTDGIMKAGNFLADHYRLSRNVDSAFHYQTIAIAAKDSLFNQQKANEIQSLSYEETLRQQQIEEEKERSRIQIRQNALLGGLATLLIVVCLLFLNNRQKKKANKLLQEQKKEIDEKAKALSVQKAHLEQSYNNVELLGEIGRKITSSLSVETIIGTVYDNVNALMDAAVFGIGIYHEDTQTIDFPATYEKGYALPAYSNSIHDQNRFAGICFSSEKEIVMADLTSEYNNYLQKLPAPVAGDQSASLIYLPLKLKEKMFGVITVQSFKKNAYSDYQLYMLRTISIYAAIALENAESYKKLNQTVNNLKKTQTQLIQSEKMASLGELTAGIAHEIQNPLNFVNNFSEVSNELINELQEERNKPQTARDASLENDILTDIKQNLEKINHHGKRADAIVKGMLQHSQSSKGKQEPTDIAKLADEYLRLAYHGLRAKDNSFNATLKTDFDESIGNINIIPQDMGRVLLNLINNAFYAVQEKSSFKNLSSLYEPAVSISTKKINNKVEIKIEDNGNGIPQNIIDKIFQPFFTTKPTGQGTGLGLSLAYDIVKAHQGKLLVESKEGQSTSFVITIPA